MGKRVSSAMISPGGGNPKVKGRQLAISLMVSVVVVLPAQEETTKVTRSPIAESVETALSFAAPEIKSGQRVYLVCDEVEGERSAEIRVNGTFAGGFIGAPCRLDVTKFVNVGANALTLRPFRVKTPRMIIE